MCGGVPNADGKGAQDIGSVSSIGRQSSHTAPARAPRASTPAPSVALCRPRFVGSRTRSFNLLLIMSILLLTRQELASAFMPLQSRSAHSLRSPQTTASCCHNLLYVRHPPEPFGESWNGIGVARTAGIMGMAGIGSGGEGVGAGGKEAGTGQTLALNVEAEPALKPVQQGETVKEQDIMASASESGEGEAISLRKGSKANLAAKIAMKLAKRIRRQRRRRKMDLLAFRPKSLDPVVYEKDADRDRLSFRRNSKDSVPMYWYEEDGEQDLLTFQRTSQDPIPDMEDGEREFLTSRRKYLEAEPVPDEKEDVDQDLLTFGNIVDPIPPEKDVERKLSEEKFVVFGDGSYGLAMANVFADRGLEVVLLVRKESVAAEINGNRRHPTYLKDCVLNENITATANPKEALKDVTFIIHAMPVQHSRKFLKNIRMFVPATTPVLFTSQGIEVNSMSLMCELLEDVLGSARKYAFLSGPSFAKEVGKFLTPQPMDINPRRGRSQPGINRSRVRVKHQGVNNPGLTRRFPVFSQDMRRGDELKD